MEEDQNGVAAAVIGRPPNSETCGMIVNHGDGGDGPTAAAVAAAPPLPALPAAAAATAFGAPARPAPRYGAHLNCNNNNSVIKGQLKGPGNLDHRNRRTRRGKRKSRKQTPYMKDGMLYRDKAVAPNNTNQFLMDDHNGTDIDKKLLARYNNENGRTRNSSYTSVESDGEQMYSSSDDDGTLIQKEFIDTYRLVQEEELAVLNKNELIQRVIELEEKIQMQESNKRSKKNTVTYLNGIPKEEDEDNSIDLEEYRSMQVQNRELITQNKQLQAEIETLKLKQSKMRNNDSNSSVDSESSSDSSSSSSSSDGQEIEMKFLIRSSGRENDQSSTKM